MSAVLQEKTEDRFPGWDKHNIWNPNLFNIAERTLFLQSLVGDMEQGTAIEELVNKYQGREQVGIQLREYAAYYITLKSKGARLPNFGRWISGMFVGNQEYNAFLANEGQKAAKRKIRMSVDPIDILRSADTHHFHSCFKKTSPGQNVNRRNMRNFANGGYEQYEYMPAVILEDCPGIGIALVDDEKGKIMGRQWMHHAICKETDENIIVLTNWGYGCLQGQTIADLLYAKGVRTAFEVQRKPGPGLTEISFIGCFKQRLHHDLETWHETNYARIIQPMITKKK